MGAQRKKVSQRIEKLRKDFGLTQPEFAKALGLEEKKGRSTINNWEQGAIQVKSDDLIRISEKFDVSSEYLLGFVDTPNRDRSIQTANVVTGLSADALFKLSDIKNRKPEFSALISAMIIDDNCEYFLSVIETLINQIGNDQELIELNISGKEANYYSGTLLKAILQTQIIDNLSSIAEIYGKVKEE